MNRNTTIGLLVVFGVLLLYVLLVQRPAELARQNQTPTAGASQPSRVWESLQADQILSIRIEDRAQGRSVAFGRPEAAASWSVTEPEPGPADQLTAANNAATVSNLTYQSVLTPTGDLSAFGVLSPTYTIEVNLADGQTLRASVGDKAPTGDYYYVSLENSPTLLVVSSFTLSSLWQWLDEPPYLPPTATATPEVSETPTDLAPTAAGTPTP